MSLAFSGADDVMLRLERLMELTDQLRRASPGSAAQLDLVARIETELVAVCAALRSHFSPASIWRTHAVPADIDQTISLAQPTESERLWRFQQGDRVIEVQLTPRAGSSVELQFLCDGECPFSRRFDSRVEAIAEALEHRRLLESIGWTPAR